MNNPFTLPLAQAEAAAPEAAPVDAPPAADNTVDPEAAITETIDSLGETIEAAFAGDTGAILTLFHEFVMPVVWAILILVAAYVISKIVGNALRRSLAKAKVDETLSRFFGKFAGYLILILGVIIALSNFGLDVTSFAAILAAAGFAVGMALSGTLGNFASGIMLLIFRPFKVGDYIKAGGTEGVVEEIELFTTTLNTLDNRHVILPNGLVHGDIIENVTFNKTRRVDVNVGVDYGASMKETRKVLLEGIANIPNALSDPAPTAYLVELGDSSVNWQVRVWCAPADYWAVRQDLTEAAKDALDAANISIPFPQMDVHLDKLNG